MKEFISKYVSLREDGKIFIPNHIKHVKLDVGLAYNAPHAQFWLENEEELYVFGFEPNVESIEIFSKGTTKRDPSHGAPIDPKYIGKTFFPIPCALGLSSEPVKFYKTRDCGLCSLYKPVSDRSDFQVDAFYDVPCFHLADFFDLFPFDTHPLIEFIKLDTQGADLDIVKSGHDYLKDRVIFVTMEGEDKQYVNTNNSQQEMDSYMKSIGFLRFTSRYVVDPSYVNSRFMDYIKTNPVKIYQNG